MCLWVLAGCLCQGAMASDMYLVPSTPYDIHFLQAGLTHIPTQGMPSQSMESLFAKARSFRYVADLKSRDAWQTPEETEARYAGDCEDKAIWLFMQMKRNGYDASLVIGRASSQSKGLHVWVESDGRVLDPTAHKRIWNATDFPEGYYRPLYSFDGSNRYRHAA